MKHTSDSPRVFISYSHDTPEHMKRVVGLSERLRDGGIDANLDQYENGTLKETWERWMLDQIDRAKFVLLICTATYYRRFRGHEEPGKGTGADWEGAIITHEIYKKRSATNKFVAVLFTETDEDFIPEPVRGHTFYVLNSNKAYEDLYDFLLGQAGVEPRPLGELKRKSRRRVEPLKFEGAGSGLSHPSVVSTLRPPKTDRTQLPVGAAEISAETEEPPRPSEESGSETLETGLEKYFQDIADSLINRRVVFFLGPGINFDPDNSKDLRRKAVCRRTILI